MIRFYSICSLFLLSLCVMVCSSCSDDNYLNAIPGESQMIISVNPAGSSVTGSPVILSSLLHLSNSDDIGLDLSQKMYFFEDSQGNLGFCTKVSDSDKLKGVLADANVQVIDKRGFQFAMLPDNWMIGFSDDASLLMGPIVPSARQDMMTLMARYLGEEEDEGIKSSPVYEKLDSIDAPMAMIAQAKALPERFVAPFCIGAPKDTDPADVMIAAAMETKGGRLLIKGHTFSFKRRIEESLADAYRVYRPIKGSYVKSMSEKDVIGMFLNVDGKYFHKLITQNRGISAMLASISAAIDMDNILKSVDGDISILAHSINKDNLNMVMAANLSGAPWLKDVGYWKQSVPQGGYIGSWGKNCYYYHGGGTTYYFGVTPDMQYMSGGSEKEALQSIKACDNPLPEDVQKMIIGQKAVMIINFAALQGTKGEAITSFIKPLFGNINSVIYTLK